MFGSLLQRSWSHALVASVLCEYPFHFNIQFITKVRPLTRLSHSPHSRPGPVCGVSCASAHDHIPSGRTRPERDELKNGGSTDSMNELLYVYSLYEYRFLYLYLWSRQSTWILVLELTISTHLSIRSDPLRSHSDLFCLPRTGLRRDELFIYTSLSYIIHTCTECTTYVPLQVTLFIRSRFSCLYGTVRCNVYRIGN
jgi:hypothetical protein